MPLLGGEGQEVGRGSDTTAFLNGHVNCVCACVSDNPCHSILFRGNIQPLHAPPSDWRCSFLRNHPITGRIGDFSPINGLYHC